MSKDEHDGCLHATDVVIHGQNIMVGAVKEAVPRDVIRRYKRNTLWLALLMFLGGWWFFRHMDSYAAQALAVVIPALWAALQFPFTWLKQDLEKSIEDLRHKWLAQHQTEENLLFCCAVALFLLGFTASIFVDLGTDVKKATITVLDEKGGRVARDIELDSAARIGGHIFLPHFRTDKIRLVVTYPPNYVAISEDPIVLRWWTAEQVDFVTHFEKKKLRALRIVPSMAVHKKVSNAGGGTVAITTSTGAVVVPQFPYAYATICVGVADRDALKALFAQKNDDEFERTIRDHLTDTVKDRDTGVVNTAQVDELLSDLRKPHFGGDRDFKENASLIVSITPDGMASMSKRVTIGPIEMTTLIFDPPVPEEKP